jgi:hypothetical protein
MDVDDEFRQPWTSGSPPSKRVRSGTIGQRLRTASDLEISGFISHAQKDAMRDKIMRGDDQLLQAMDLYAVGNGTALQHLILTGVLDAPVSTSYADAVDALEMEVSEGLTCVARTCRVCHQQFTMNHDKACVYHPESFCGETAQRWMAPGETRGGGIVHNFYSCCGATEINAPGCCARRHFTYDTDDVPGVEQRRPGMGL